MAVTAKTTRARLDEDLDEWYKAKKNQTGAYTSAPIVSSGNGASGVALNRPSANAIQSIKWDGGGGTIAKDEEQVLTDEDKLYNAYEKLMRDSAAQGEANMTALNEQIQAAANQQVDAANATMDENLAAIERQRQENLRDAAITYERMEKYLPNYLKASGLYGQGISENAMIRMGNDYLNSRQSANRSAQDAELVARQQNRTSVAEYLANATNQIAKNQYEAKENTRNVENALAQSRFQYDANKLANEQTAQADTATSLKDYLTNIYENYMGDETLTKEEAANLRAFYDIYKDNLTDEQKAAFEKDLAAYDKLAVAFKVDEEALESGKAFRASDGKLYRLKTKDLEKEKVKDFTKEAKKNSQDYKFAMLYLKQQGFNNLYDPNIPNGTVIFGDYTDEAFVYYNGEWYKATRQA